MTAPSKGRTSVLDTPWFNERLFFARRERSRPPAGAIDLEVAVPGARLHLRWHQAEAARATVLLFHGNGELVADYDETAPELLRRAGCALAVVDYRGYGKSTGTPTLRAIIEDAPFVLQALVTEAPGPVVVMGRSLGSACAAELYGRDPKDVSAAGFIYESGFVDLDALVEGRGMPRRPFEPGEVETFDPVPKLARGKHPLLVLHGALDDMIVPAEAEAAFASAGTSEKSLVLIEDRGHNDISESPRYWEAIESFASGLTARP